MTTKLRLGPLPKAQPVKITITVTAEFKETPRSLRGPALASNGEKNDVERLIPYMLEAFIERDRRLTAYRNPIRSAYKQRCSGRAHFLMRSNDEKRGFTRQEAIEYLGVKGRFFDLRVRPRLQVPAWGLR